MLEDDDKILTVVNNDLRIGNPGLSQFKFDKEKKILVLANQQTLVNVKGIDGQNLNIDNLVCLAGEQANFECVLDIGNVSLPLIKFTWNSEEKKYFLEKDISEF